MLKLQQGGAGGTYDMLICIGSLISLDRTSSVADSVAYRSWLRELRPDQIAGILLCLERFVQLDQELP